MILIAEGVSVVPLWVWIEKWKASLSTVFEKCCVQENKPNVIVSSREEIAEAQRTNKPSGRCHYCLMISKTCKEASKSIPARGGAPKDEYMFVNAEEEFFYEVNASKI